MNRLKAFMEGVTLYIPWLVLMFIHACSAACNMCLERSLLSATILIDSKQPVQPNLAAWIYVRMDARSCKDTVILTAACTSDSRLLWCWDSRCFTV